MFYCKKTESVILYLKHTENQILYSTGSKTGLFTNYICISKFFLAALPTTVSSHLRPYVDLIVTRKSVIVKGRKIAQSTSVSHFTFALMTSLEINMFDQLKSLEWMHPIEEL